MEEKYQWTWKEVKSLKQSIEDQNDHLSDTQLSNQMLKKLNLLKRQEQQGESLWVQIGHPFKKGYEAILELEVLSFK